MSRKVHFRGFNSTYQQSPNTSANSSDIIRIGVGIYRKNVVDYTILCLQEMRNPGELGYHLIRQA